MRYIRSGLLLFIGLVLLVIAFANRETVTLRLLPDEFDGLWSLGRTVELPLFLVILGALFAGVALGFVWEWIREHKYRSAAGRRAREAASLQREVDKIKGTNKDQDEVLRLLDNAPGS